MWDVGLEPYGAGEFSVAVVQANDSLEDQGQVLASPSATFVGVFDGHGGPEAARFVSDRLLPYLDRTSLLLPSSIPSSKSNLDASISSKSDLSRVRFGARRRLGGGDQEGLPRDGGGLRATGDEVPAGSAADGCGGLLLPRRRHRRRRRLRGQSGGLQGHPLPPEPGKQVRGRRAAVDGPQRSGGGSEEGGS